MLEIHLNDVYGGFRMLMSTALHYTMWKAQVLMWLQTPSQDFRIRTTRQP